jgi:hypothetical protein
MGSAYIRLRRCFRRRKAWSFSTPLRERESCNYVRIKTVYQVWEHAVGLMRGRQWNRALPNHIWRSCLLNFTLKCMCERTYSFTISFYLKQERFKFNFRSLIVFKCSLACREKRTREIPVRSVCDTLLMIRPDICSTWNEVSFRIYTDEHIPTYTISLHVDEFNSNAAFPRLEVRSGTPASYSGRIWFEFWTVCRLPCVRSYVFSPFPPVNFLDNKLTYLKLATVALFLTVAVPCSSP